MCYSARTAGISIIIRPQSHKEYSRWHTKSQNPWDPIKTKLKYQNPKKSALNFQKLEGFLEEQFKEYSLWPEVSFQLPFRMVGGRGKQHSHTHTQTDIATFRLIRPRDQISENTKKIELFGTWAIPCQKSEKIGQCQKEAFFDEIWKSLRYFKDGVDRFYH